MTWSVVVICALPFVLNLLGVDFASTIQPFATSAVGDLAAHELVDSMFLRLSGAFAHALLEWSAFCTAIFTVLLAISHFYIKRDVTTPVIAVALFCAGAMDAFHTLAADRLIEAVADNRDLIPFTWAICRLFNALILITGVSIFLIRKSLIDPQSKKGIRFVLITSLAFGCIAYIIINLCATSAELPRTQFPSSLIRS